MKSILAEKLINICGTDNDHGYGIDNLTARQLKEVEAVLIEYLEFSRIEWVDLPRVAFPGKSSKACQTVRLTDDISTYKGKIGYVYKVCFTPIMFDVTEYRKCDNSISPVVYDPTTFEPKRYITLSYSPSQSTGTLESDIKSQLRDQLDDILRNPEKYQQSGYRAALLRFFAE
jgi:hypothetical protein